MTCVWYFSHESPSCSGIIVTRLVRSHSLAQPPRYRAALTQVGQVALIRVGGMRLLIQQAVLLPPRFGEKAHGQQLSMDDAVGLERDGGPALGGRGSEAQRWQRAYWAAGRLTSDVSSAPRASSSDASELLTKDG